jgi:hypothetical protein
MPLGKTGPPKYIHCLRIVFVIGKFTDIFFFGGGGDFMLGRIYYGEKFSWGGNFPGLIFPGEILLREDLQEFLYEILLICLTFCFSTKFNLLRFCWGNFLRDRDCLERFSMQ